MTRFIIACILCVLGIGALLYGAAVAALWPADTARAIPGTAARTHTAQPKGGAMTTAEKLRKADWRVLPVPMRTARRIVYLHHYAQSCGATSVFTHGLFYQNQPDCHGVAVWQPPTLGATQGIWDGDPHRVLSLSRLAIAPDVPANAASFLVGASIRLIRADGRYRCLVTYADTWQGHTGAIYKATNWEYLGLVPGAKTWLDPQTKRLVADKVWTGYRTNEEMTAAGYECIGRFPKHKYRLILPPARAPKTLFSALEASA